MSTLRKALLIVSLAAFCGLPLAAQLTDCAFTRTFTGDLNAASSSNLSGNTPCVNWRVTYSVTGTLTSTVTFQTSPDNTNWTSVPNTLCSSTTQPPCILQGTNPLTGTTQGMSLFAAYGAYVRVITSGSAGTGTGTIRGYGAKGATATVSGGNGIGGGNVTSTGGLTLDAVILGNGGLDIKAGAVLPGDVNKFYDGTGNFSVIPTIGTLIYYYTNTASSIATYLQSTALPQASPVTLSFPALATGTDTLQNWSTNAGIPNLTFIPQGIFTQHIHALRTGGGTVTLHTQIWEVDSSGVDIAMIGQTEDTAALTTSQVQYNIEFASSAPYILASASSRIVGRVFAVVSGSAPTVQIFVGGTADTRLGLPSNTVDATNFVPYTGAVSNVDLATHDLLTGTGNGGFGTDLRTGNVLPMTKLVAWGGNLVVGDPATLGTESLTNGALTSGTSWSVTGDFALAANAATYTHSAGSGTLTQAAVDLAVAGVGNRWYKFVYSVSAVTAGMTACSITTAFSDNTFGIVFDITAGVGKVFYFKSKTTPGAFVISCTSTAGGLTLDDLSLKEVQGGNAIVYGLVTGGGAFGLKVRANGNAEISNDINGGNLTVTSSSNAASIGIIATNTGGRNWRLISGSSAAAVAPSGFAIQDTAVETRVYIDALGQVAIGHTTGVAYSLDVSKGVGLTGTARFFDQTATTGATLVTITPGASQTAASLLLDVGGNIRLGSTNSTAAVAGVIGATCPAITCTAAYTWVQAIAADNSVVYFPVWK